jgi:hypothetical protein
MSRQPSGYAICRAPILAILIALAPITLHAQVVPGDTVRITRLNWEYVGQLVSLDSARAVIYSAKGDTLTFPLDRVEHAEVLRSHHRSGWSSVGKGAGIGLLVGVALAVLTVTDKSGTAESRELNGVAAAFCVLAGTGTGLVIGTVAGVSNSEIWEPFDLPQRPPTPQ